VDSSLKSLKRAGRMYRPASTLMVMTVFPEIAYSVVYKGYPVMIDADATGILSVRVKLTSAEFVLYPGDWYRLKQVIENVRASLTPSLTESQRYNQIKAEIRKVFNI